MNLSFIENQSTFFKSTRELTKVHNDLSAHTAKKKKKVLCLLAEFHQPSQAITGLAVLYFSENQVLLTNKGTAGEQHHKMPADFVGSERRAKG